MRPPDSENLKKVIQWLEFGDEDLRLARHELPPFAITARYPSQDEAVTREESLRAIEIALKGRESIREVLEKEGLNLPLDM